MAKTYINKATGTESISNARIISVGAPFDVRTVVDTYNDLLDKDVFSCAHYHADKSVFYVCLVLFVGACGNYLGWDCFSTCKAFQKALPEF